MDHPAHAAATEGIHAYSKSSSAQSLITADQLCITVTGMLRY